MTEQRRASQRKYHFVYKTTCTVTGKWYIGMHSTDNLNDGYLGSGQRLWKCIKKYGKENHTVEILEYLPDRKSLAEREKELLSEEIRKHPLCMNIGPGGEGHYDRPPTSAETAAKLSAASKKYVRTKEWYEKTVATRRKNKSYFHTPEVREQIRLKHLGKVLTEEHKMKISVGGTGLKRTEETSQNISASVSKPCTVDGLTIYPSVGALATALGTGNAGTRSPTFRYLNGKTKSVVMPFSDERREAVRKARRALTEEEKLKSRIKKQKLKDLGLYSRKKAKTRSCTVNGIDIYPSLKALVKVLGAGITGARSPDLRFTSEAPNVSSEIIEAALQRVRKSNPRVINAKGIFKIERQQRPCTVDGLTIYPSTTALGKILGQGKDGLRSPTFRYALPNEAVNISDEFIKAAGPRSRKNVNRKYYV